MNKKMLLGGALGLVALASGAIALTSLGGPGSGESTVVRPALAQSSSSFEDPFVYAPELGSFGGDYVGAVKLKAPLGQAAPQDSEGPSSGGSNPDADAQPEAGAQGDAGPGQADDDSAPPPYNPGKDPANGEKPPIPYNPQVNDAICDAIGCDQPDMPYNPQVNDAICDAVGCDEPDMPHNPQVDDAICDAVDCDQPVLAITPLKGLLCAILGNCESDDDSGQSGGVHLSRNCQLGLEECDDEPQPKPKLPADAILSRH